LFGVKSLGLIFGVLLFAESIGSFSGPLVAGYAFDAAGSYDTVFAVMAGISISAAILGILLFKCKIK
jgi:cyanate permease